jgi:hypothetical protein
VGTPETVVEALADYHKVGVETFLIHPGLRSAEHRRAVRR